MITYSKRTAAVYWIIPLTMCVNTTSTYVGGAGLDRKVKIAHMPVITMIRLKGLVDTLVSLLP